MRWILFACVIVGHGCTLDRDDNYSDEAWKDVEQGDVTAELEDAAAAEDTTAPPLETDDMDDPNEVDDVPLPESDDVTAIARAGQYRNAIASNCADPGVIRVAGANGPTFWAACTGNGYPRFKSRDLVHWTAAGHIFQLSTKPSWASGNFWAPEIHHIGNGFVAYFAALSPSRGKMCIGAARASSIEGPWSDLGHPLVCDHHVGLIDPNVFTDAQGRHFLYYKTDSNGLTPQEPTVIYGHALRTDGLGFVGVRHRLIANSLPWEGDVVEAPWVMQRGRYFFMFYSGYRYCNGTYGVGVARATSALGPFRKRSAPILRSSGTWVGPGHNSIVATGGHDYIVYHAWHGAHTCGQSGDRELMLDRITWRGGWPSINNGTPSQGVRAAPTVP